MEKRLLLINKIFFKGPCIQLWGNSCSPFQNVQLASTLILKKIILKASKNSKSAETVTWIHMHIVVIQYDLTEEHIFLLIHKLVNSKSFSGSWVSTKLSQAVQVNHRWIWSYPSYLNSNTAWIFSAAPSLCIRNRDRGIFLLKLLNYIWYFWRVSEQWLEPLVEIHP